MDSNVIQFPTRTVHNWVKIERIFRDILRGNPPVMADEICGRMKESWKKFDIQILLPFQVPVGFYLNGLEKPSMIQTRSWP